MKRKDEMLELLREYGFYNQSQCTKEENEVLRRKEKEGIPSEEGLYRDYEGSYFRLERTDMTEEELNRYLKLKSVRYLSRISMACTAAAVILFLLLCKFLFGM